MKITVNNKSLDVAADKQLICLLEEMGITPEKTLISINEEIIAQDSFKPISLKENDIVDLFTFVGGG